MTLGKGLLETGTCLYPTCAFPQVKKSLHKRKGKSSICDSMCLLITRDPVYFCFLFMLMALDPMMRNDARNMFGIMLHLS